MEKDLPQKSVSFYYKENQKNYSIIIQYKNLKTCQTDYENIPKDAKNFIKINTESSSIEIFPQLSSLMPNAPNIKLEEGNICIEFPQSLDSRQNFVKTRELLEKKKFKDLANKMEIEKNIYQLSLPVKSFDGVFEEQEKKEEKKPEKTEITNKVKYFYRERPEKKYEIMIKYPTAQACSNAYKNLSYDVKEFVVISEENPCWIIVQSSRGEGTPGTYFSKGTGGFGINAGDLDRNKDNGSYPNFNSLKTLFPPYKKEEISKGAAVPLSTKNTIYFSGKFLTEYKNDEKKEKENINVMLTEQEIRQIQYLLYNNNYTEENLKLNFYLLKTIFEKLKDPQVYENLKQSLSVSNISAGPAFYKELKSIPLSNIELEQEIISKLKLFFNFPEFSHKINSVEEYLQHVINISQKENSEKNRMAEISAENLLTAFRASLSMSSQNIVKFN